MNIALLKYLALSTGVHADALECHVAENRSVLHHLASDAKCLTQLEAQLEAAVAAAGRIGTVGGVLLAARSARAATGGGTGGGGAGGQISSMLQGARRVVSASAATTPGSSSGGARGAQPQQQAATARMVQQCPTAAAAASPQSIQSAGDALRLAAMAVDFSDASMAPKIAPDQAIANAEAAVARLQHAMVVAERQSVEWKLRRLEGLKATAAARRPSREDLLDASAGFCFAPDVEALWNTRINDAYSKRSQRHANNFNQVDDVVHEEDDAAIDGQAPPSFFASVLHGAVERFKSRYMEALEMLRMMEADSAIEAMTLEPLAAAADRLNVSAVKRVCSAVLYAQMLSSPQHNSDLRLVLDLEQADAHTLGHHFERLCATYWTRGPDPLAAATAGGDACRRVAGASSCVGLSPSYFLPQDWACTRALQAALQRETLPPARHVLCDRFSFADHQELLSLEILRVEVQARVMSSVLFSGGGDDDYRSTAAMTPSVGRGWVRDVASARAALVLQECAASLVARSSSISMPVLARIEDDDDRDADSGEED